jgi:hypothetical protein
VKAVNNMNEKELRKKIRDQELEIQDLLVLIDTLQTNLRSAVSCIPEKDRGQIENVRSFKWCLEWRKK